MFASITASLSSPTLIYLLLLVVAIFLLRKKLRGRKRKYKFAQITDEEKNILCDGESVFQFNALLEHKPTLCEDVKIILTNNHVMWSSNDEQNKIWTVIESKELLGSKLNNQNGQTTIQNTNKGNKVTIFAFSESNKKYFNQGIKIEEKKEILYTRMWIMKMLRIVYLQTTRYAEMILFGQEGTNPRHHLQISFLFINNSNSNSEFNSSVSLKLQSLRFHRLILHTCAKTYSENSIQVLNYSKNNSVHIPEAPPKRRIKFIVNPVSGNKQSKMIVETMIPFLDGSSELIDYDIDYTERCQHGKEIAKEFDYTKYNGVVCIGGDGMIFEVINGIMDRENGEEIFKLISIGIIPAGTGNGIAATLGFANDIEDAIVRVVRGRSNPLDVMRIHQDDNPKLGFVYCCLQASYGMMPDVDFDSEKLRWLGELRFTLYAMFLIFFIRKYPIKLRFKPDYIKRVRNKKLCLDENDKELVINTRALWIGGLNTKYIANEFMGAPNAQIDDGLIHVLILPILNKITLFTLLFDMSDGRHVNHDGIQLYGTKSFEITAEPYKNRPMRLDVDGEQLPILASRPVHVDCMPGLCNIYV